MVETSIIEVVYQYRTTGAAEAKLLWLDVDGCFDSEYTTPVGYHNATVDWTSTVSGRMIGPGGAQPIPFRDPQHAFRGAGHLRSLTPAPGSKRTGA